MEYRTQFFPTDPRAWWHKSDTEGTGIDASIEIVKEAVLNNGPFDGILGFSQGAALLGVISAYINSKGETGVGDVQVAECT